MTTAAFHQRRNEQIRAMIGRTIEIRGVEVPWLQNYLRVQRAASRRRCGTCGRQGHSKQACPELRQLKIEAQLFGGDINDTYDAVQKTLRQMDLLTVAAQQDQDPVSTGSLNGKMGGLGLSSGKAAKRDSPEKSPLGDESAYDAVSPDNKRRKA